MESLRNIVPMSLAGSLLLIGSVLIVVCCFPARPEREVSGSLHDPELLREIELWKPGHPPPARLLIIPSDIAAKSAPTYRRPLFDDGETLAGITNKDLLAAVLFDPRAGPESVSIAARRFVNLSGAEGLSRLLGEKRKRAPSAVTGALVVMLEPFLHSPTLMLQAVRVGPSAMPSDKAESVLQEMRRDLEAGNGWEETYAKFAGLYPAQRDDIRGSGVQGSAFERLCMGPVTPNGWSVETGHVLEALPAEHLEELFRAQRGTHIWKSARGVYLYHIPSLDERVP